VTQYRTNWIEAHRSRPRLAFVNLPDTYRHSPADGVIVDLAPILYRSSPMSYWWRASAGGQDIVTPWLTREGERAAARYPRRRAAGCSVPDLAAACF